VVDAHRRNRHGAPPCSDRNGPARVIQSHRNGDLGDRKRLEPAPVAARVTSSSARDRLQLAAVVHELVSYQQ
jgi:hypothetical protein